MQTPTRPRRTLLHHLALASVFVPAAITLLPLTAQAAPVDDLKTKFVTPPDTARPWVYWYFMDGNLSKEGMKADLEAMKKAGIGGGIYLEVGIGVPRGPVEFMSPEWQDHIKYAVMESQRQGLSLALGTGPGWTGSGGPWVKTEQSMQHLVASETNVTGPTRYDAVLPRPKPRGPFFGEWTLNEGKGLHDEWSKFYADEVVLAFPTPAKGARLDNIDKKALYYRAPYTGDKSTPRLPTAANYPAVPAAESVAPGKIINLTGKLASDGRLNWDVPAGEWTIMRFGRTATGQTTRPAPVPGIGFESDKFSQEAVAAHMKAYTGVLLDKIGPNFRKGNTGLTMLHFDSWEMSSQNWTQAFKAEFIKRRGYDPTPYLPSMIGYVVENRERSERFLWD
ncbi:glycosyl hydrolase, partial [bacterium]